MQLESLKSQQMSSVRSTSFLTSSVLVSTGVLLPLLCRTDRAFCPVFTGANETLCILTVYMSNVFLSSAHREASSSTSSNTCFLWLCTLAESQGDCCPSFFTLRVFWCQTGAQTNKVHKDLQFSSFLCRKSHMSFLCDS